MQHNISWHPKLSLPTFGGDSIQWQTFWDSFDVAVHSNAGLSGVNYLRAQLHEDTSCVIAGFPLAVLPSAVGVVCASVTLQDSIWVSEFTVEMSVGGGEVGSITVSTSVGTEGGAWLALHKNSVRKTIRLSKLNWYSSAVEISSFNFVLSSIFAAIELFKSTNWLCLALSWQTVEASNSLCPWLIVSRRLLDLWKGYYLLC